MTVKRMMRRNVGQLIGALLVIALALIESPCVLCEESKSVTVDSATVQKYKSNVVSDFALQEKKFLNSVAPTLRSWRTFGEWSKCLKNANIANVYSASARINKEKCEPLVESAHKLTFAETFETVARQTKSTVHYDAKAQQWNFEEPQMPLPYSISICNGWKAEDRGFYVAYVPAIAPVGMDIYMNGRFKGLKEQQLKDIRDEQALVFADRMHNGVTVEEMTPITVDGVEALYYKTKAPVEGRQWRQWAFIKGGQSFLIVSAVSDQNEAKLIPDVEKMVQSFHVLEPPIPFPGY